MSFPPEPGGAVPPGAGRPLVRRILAPFAPARTPGWALVSALLTGGAGAALVLYGARGAVGAAMATSWLEAQGVPSAFRIDRLDSAGFTGALRLGRPDRPDLVSDHVELSFTPDLHLRAARVVEPQLRARFDGRRLDFGTLQGLVERAFSGPRSTGPGADIRVERGLAMLATPYGPLRVLADGHLAHQTLVSLDASLLPARLSGPGGAVAAIDLGRLQAAGVPGGIKGRLTLAASTAKAAGASATGARLELDGDLAGRGLLPTGPFSLDGRVSAAEAEASHVSLRKPAARVQFHGHAAGPLERLTVDGGGAAELAATELVRGAVRVIGLQAHFAGEDLRLARTGGRWRAQAPGALAVRADRLARGADFVRSARLAASFSGLAVDGAGGMAAASGSGRVELAAAELGLGGMRLGPATTAATGRLRASADGAAFSGALSGRTVISRAQATRWSAAIPLAGPAAEGALRALTLSAPEIEVASGPDGASVSARRPLHISGADGAGLTVSGRGRAPLIQLAARGGAQGAFDLAAQGPGFPRVRAEVASYALGRDRGGLAGRLQAGVQLAGDLGQARGLALEAAGEITRRGGLTLARLDRCARVEVAHYGDLASAIAGALCPTSGPLLRSDGERWRLDADLREATGALAQAQVKLAGSARLSVDNAAGQATGEAAIARLAVQDLANRRRFEPLVLAGPLRLADGAWRGRLRLALAGGAPLGTVTLRAAADADAGEVRLDTGELRFAEGGLQPRSVSPLAPDALSRVEGTAGLTAQVSWRGRTLESGAKLETPGIAFTGALGRVAGAKGALIFDSLLPLTTPPGQTVTADSVAWLTPLTDVRASFQLTPEALRLEAAQAQVSGGSASLDPLTLSFAPRATTKGVLRLAGIDLGRLIADTSLADKIRLDAKLGGALPFALGPEGLRFAGGRVAADGPGRLSIDPRALSGGAAKTSPVQNLAYQAVQDLAFSALDAAVDSQPGGRLGVVFHINGRHAPPRPTEARVGLFDLLGGRALDKPIDLPSGTPVNLTLDTSLNFDELLAAYGQAARPRSEPVQADPGS